MPGWINGCIGGKVDGSMDSMMVHPVDGWMDG